MRGVLVGALVLYAAAGCTKKNPEYCESDQQCLLTAAPFCDVDGAFTESGFEAHTCSERPEGCPIERCGCTVGETTCAGDQLSVCNEDGRTLATSRCSLGCAAEGTRCLTFEPSNDLGGPLEEASQEPDVLLPSGVRIDTSTGVITTAGGATLTVRSKLVSQGTSMIRVFLGKSFVIDDAVITGTHAFAAVSPGRILVKGRVDASATGRTGGPGAQDGPAACIGQFTVYEQCGSGNCAAGASGGGNATPGGKGGGLSPQPQRPGGAIQTSFAPLEGGCRGGNHRNSGGTVLNDGGAGGGAIQLVSLDSVALTEFGLIDVGAGGGDVTAGGGSGGTILIEAPVVRVTGPTAGFTANGGAGGGCNGVGQDGTPTTMPALTASMTNCFFPGGTVGRDPSQRLTRPTAPSTERPA
jgi:hypothetical protein